MYEEYLEESEIINFSNPKIQALAKTLAQDCKDDEAIAKNCFLYVRDEIHHSGDFKDKITTLKASEVLEYKTGWCYAKSHLLAALLRINHIPTGFCYQRLSCGEYKDEVYCLHGLNAIFLKKYGWYRIDARGNKAGVDAQFNPTFENLAFELQDKEFDIANIYSKPLDVVVNALESYGTYDEMIRHFPIVDEFICKVTLKDAQQLSSLSNSLLKYLFEEETPKWFEDSFNVEEFEKRILSSEYKHFGYVIENKIVGFIAIKEDSHLFHLFVDEKYHQQNIGKKLWEFVKENIDFEVMSTNASLYAINVYESFGFTKDKEIQTYKELEFLPMIYKREKL